MSDDKAVLILLLHPRGLLPLANWLWFLFPQPLLQSLLPSSLLSSSAQLLSSLFVLFDQSKYTPIYTNMSILLPICTIQLVQYAVCAR